jgi:16S rRNA (guanine527-N7)-methyltransferase
LRDIFFETLKYEAEKLNIELNKPQLEKFFNYADFLLEYNKKINLTSIISYHDIIIKHFIDSILPNKILNKKEKTIDVGSGAGFPGIPLKIVNPGISLTALDSSGKKIKFLNELSQKINIKLETVCDRAEEIAKTDLRESFEVCVSRAVAPLNVLCELCLPLVKIGGIFIAFKGPNAKYEILNSKRALEVLGGEIFCIENFNLSKNLGQRVIIKIKKTKNTPKNYPRLYAKILSERL